MFLKIKINVSGTFHLPPFRLINEVASSLDITAVRLWQCCNVPYFILFQDCLMCRLELSAAMQTHTDSSIVTKEIREETFLLFYLFYQHVASDFEGVRLCEDPSFVWDEMNTLYFGHIMCLHITSFAQIYHFKALNEPLCDLCVPYPSVNANFFQWAAQTSALWAVNVSYTVMSSPAYYNPPELESERSTWP